MVISPLGCPEICDNGLILMLIKPFHGKVPNEKSYPIITHAWAKISLPVD